MTSTMLLELLLIGTVLGASVCDLAVRRIPNRLLLAALLCGAAVHLLAGGPFRLVSTGLAGLATGLLVFLPLYATQGMAAGDVKLMATVGALCGPQQALQICLLTFCAGGLMALAMVIAKGRLRETLANVGALLRPLFWRLLGVPLVKAPLARPSVGGMPYGLAIAIGTFLTLYRHHS